MKPLLSPARMPHPDLLQQQLGFTASTFQWRDRHDFDSRKSSVLGLIQSVVHSPRVLAKTEDEGNHCSFHGIYEFVISAQEATRHGHASFAYTPRQEQKGAVSGRFHWDSLPGDIEEIVKVADDLWLTGALDSLYFYDEFDCAIQNMDMPFGMKHYGIDIPQVDVIKVGGVDVIDTRHNPGFVVNSKGLLVSAQWLSYWSARAQELLFGGPPQRVPAGVDLLQLGSGTIRLRLAKSPGRFDDVGFHHLQLETRRCLGLSH